MELEIRKIVKCGSCNSQKIDIIANFGKVPLAGYFPYPGEEDERNLVNLELLKCVSCSLIQASPDVSGESLFLDYRYASRYSMKTHFSEMSKWIKNSLKIPKTSKILEIGSNDGTLMNFLRELNYSIEGVDPSINVTKHAIENGHSVEVGFFSPEMVTNKNWQNKFDVVISTNSFAHISEIGNIAYGISLALQEDGISILEVQSWPELVRTGAFDFVYHEHKYYYDLEALKNLLSPFRILIEHVELTTIHGGSYRIVFRKLRSNLSEDEFVQFDISAFENSPSKTHITESINLFFKKLDTLKQLLIEKQEKGFKIIGFGGSGRANMLVTHMNPNGLIDYILDESPERIGRNLGLSRIKIVNFETFKSQKEDSYDLVLVLAWNFYSEIKSKWPHKNKILIQPLPFYFESTSQ